MGPFDAFKRAISSKPASSPPAASTDISPLRREQDFGANQPVVDRINGLEAGIEILDDAQLVERFQRARSAAERNADDVLEEIYAIVREVSFRVLGLRHYDVQILGAIELHKGCIAEMATGEGKTIVAALPSVLNAATGNHVLVVTVNDYLARRDAELIGKIHRFLGLSVGLIQANMSTDERKKAYACDITYVTNSELGFDYLRDNLAFSEDDLVISKPFGFCIVDEADSILIDEARTPLIISGKNPAPTEKYSVANQASQQLRLGVHYSVNKKEQSVLLTERGYEDLEKALKVADLFDVTNPWASYIINALKAKEIFEKDINYIVDPTEEGEGVQIVDEFTGRVMKGRRWSGGLHQAIEAKESISVSDETVTAASISYQSFFKLFDKLAGMTGTAVTEKEELLNVYGLNVVQIPTALPTGRKDYPDVVFKNFKGKLNSIMGEIARVAPTGRPILIGTTSVDSSEALSQLLTEVEVEHEVLNAKPEFASRESEIVAQAGRKYSITIATNMAGRGTDIVLGGNSSFFAKAIMRREFASRNEDLFEALEDILIDDEVLPADLSEDVWNDIEKTAEFVARNNSAQLFEDLGSIDRLISAASEYTGESDGREGGISGLKEVNEILAKIEDDLRETVELEREEVLDLGGLYIIGTERGESRRIDNQLRGRAGRQGDPGTTRFFLALDDKLFKMFGGDKMADILESFRVGDDLPIENSVVTKALDNAQANVEEYFKDIRAQLFNYDEVLSVQRNVVYNSRRKILEETPTQLMKRFTDDCYIVSDEIFDSYMSQDKADTEGMVGKLAQFFAGISLDNSASIQKKESVHAAVDELVAVQTDKLSGKLMTEATRYIWLTQVDNLWMGHMKAMDYLKEFIVLRSYASDDPLAQYQIEGFELYEEMQRNVRRNTVYSLFQYKPAPAESKSAETVTN